MMKMTDVAARALARDMLNAAATVFDARVVWLSPRRVMLDHPCAVSRLIVCDDWPAARRVEVLRGWLRVLHHRLLSEWLRSA